MCRSRFLRVAEIVFWGVVLSLIVWLVLYWPPPRSTPQLEVGIIRINTSIWSVGAELVQAQIEEAREDDSIKAVVVQLDSPGGEVVASQTLYLELQKLRREMPVVGSRDSLAASGA